MERRLAAILSADVQGCSRLMADDEAATVRTLTAYRALMAARVDLWGLGHAHYLTQRYEEAIAALRQALTRNPDWIPAHVYLAASYGELGRAAEARAAIAEVLRLSPEGSEESLRQSLPYKDPADLERFLGALRRAGFER